MLRAGPETIARVRAGTVPKGDALATARAAGILAAKRTPELIPFCHPIPITHADVLFNLRADAIVISASASAVWSTGVEMEALTAAGIAALTLYDMLKPLDSGLEIERVRLLAKQGGKSDFEKATTRPVHVAVVVISDRVAGGRAEDRSGGAVAEALASLHIEAAPSIVLPDDRDAIEATLRRLSDEEHCDLILTTGGTGLGPRDRTVEATRAVIEREVPGISEAARGFGQERDPRSMLSRALAGVRGRTLVVNLPGSPKGVREALAPLLPGILHAVGMLAGEGHGE